jgi:RNA polymerase sigma factor (TIGR02999 family)
MQLMFFALRMSCSTFGCVDRAVTVGGFEVVFESSLVFLYNSVTPCGSPNPGITMTDVTRILNAIEQGDIKATDELLPLVYEELRHLAARKLSHEQPGQTLQATALVHEAYIRLMGSEARNWNSRGHFFKAAAEAMRRILVENARRKKSLKQGGNRQRIRMDEIALADCSNVPSDYLIALDEALVKFSEKHRIKAEVVKLRYFAGLTIEQTAKVLGISEATTKRYWIYARAWLVREIS